MKSNVLIRLLKVCIANPFTLQVAEDLWVPSPGVLLGVAVGGQQPQPAVDGRSGRPRNDLNRPFEVASHFTSIKASLVSKY